MVEATDLVRTPAAQFLVGSADSLQGSESGTAGWSGTTLTHPIPAPTTSNGRQPVSPRIHVHK